MGEAVNRSGGPAAGRWAGWALGLTLALCVSALSGCTSPQPAPKTLPPRYETLPPKELPPFLRGTILEQMDHINPDPIRVSAFALVVDLPGTGDGTAPTAVREYIMKELARRGFGSVSRPELQRLTPERVVDDPARRTAIVLVDGFMPPGIRKGESFDVVVSALPDSGVTSLAGGRLYRTELKWGGGDPRLPAGPVHTEAIAEGTIFINPSLMLNPRTGGGDEAAAKLSRRQGVIMDGGIATVDQPLILRMRAPQRALIRQIEFRIDQQFLDPNVASAKDEAILHLMVPERFRGDWEHFLGVVMNLYIDGTPELLVARARQLAEEALKPDAPLQNISYAWEGMGAVALPAVLPLMSPEHPQEVQFAAARAAAFIGDPTAQTALVRIAMTEGHRFQTDAVRTLGNLRPTPSVASALRQLLESPSALVRIEAYRVLARNRDRVIASVILPEVGRDERFVLDMVPSSRPPLVYATRSGIPRIALIGPAMQLQTPITFTALDDRFMITSRPGEAGVVLFHRRDGNARPVQVSSSTRLDELIGWLGGGSRDPAFRFDLTYGEVVAIVQALADQGRLVAAGRGDADAGAVAVNFLLQDAPDVEDLIADAPRIVPRDRSAGDLQGPALGPAETPPSPPRPLGLPGSGVEPATSGRVGAASP